MIRTEASKSVLSQLPACGQVWPMFLSLVETPRASFNPKSIVPHLQAMAKDLGFECIVDEANNVLMRCPATPGYEATPGICFQAHWDIVAQKNPDVQIDFEKDPLVPRIEKREDGDWLMATGTSLGADDGIGIAMGMSAMVEKDVPHGPLELLITCDEEVGLIGASALKPGFLKSKYLVNIDSEDYGVITISCAGGFNSTWTIPFAPQPIEGAVGVKCGFKGFRGGHTGVDIQMPVGNAVKMLARTLLVAREDPEIAKCMSLGSINGGTAHNAIPRDSVAEVLICPSKLDEFEKRFRAEATRVIEAYKVKGFDEEADFFFERDASVPQGGVSVEETGKIIDFICLAPMGMYRYSPAVKGLVETSYATTVFTTKLDEKIITVLGAGRSSVEAELEYTHERCKALGRVFGYTVSPMIGRYGAWPAAPQSALLTIGEQVWKEITGEEPKVEAIHAGLEAGCILKTHPTMEAISVGPTVIQPHSPKEALHVKTVEPTYKLLLGIMKRFAEQK